MKIVIVGGGTAGWLSALFVSKIHDDHSVTLIESSKIGIIGAGEGSTGHLRDIVTNGLYDFGCNEQDFFKETGATVKLGIKHKNWTPKKDWSYYGPIDGTMTPNEVPDYHFLHAVANDIPAHLITQLGTLIDDKKSTFLTESYGTGNHAYHFDAHKVGQYFKKVCGDKVKNIDAEVLDVVLDPFNGYITKLKLSDGQEIEGDFFIDASGFKKVLMEKLDNKWISYNDNLPVNSAMPFLLPYTEDDYKDLEPVTTAWACDAGWMWQIPTVDRYGCGYVFDDRFITPEQAQDEIENKLGKKIEPIKILKFESGRLQEPWKKNCLAVGLSAAFSEPLEATSIHATIIQLTFFVFEYLRSTQNQTVSDGSAYMYNRRVNGMYDNFKEFLEIHYMGGRTDTDFWRWINTGETQSDLVKSVIEQCKHKVPVGHDFAQNYGYAGWVLWAFILKGTGHISKELAGFELDFYGKRKHGEEIFTQNNQLWTPLQQRCLSMEEFVRSRQKINTNGDT